jgi:hypothetical protein
MDDLLRDVCPVVRASGDEGVGLTASRNCRRQAGHSLHADRRPPDRPSESYRVRRRGVQKNFDTRRISRCRRKRSRDSAGQTPIYHAIASVGGGNFPTLEHLVSGYRRSIDPDVRATFRLSDGAIQTLTVTPLEFAESAARDETPNWRSSEREIALMRSLASAG